MDAREPASFRDPSGFVFRRSGVLLRQVNEEHGPHYDRLMKSGLYADLVERRLLVPHEEVEEPPSDRPAHRVIRPLDVRFLTYPYEWSFGQLRDAALLTLDIQATALEFGMTLKDGSAYNVQFLDGRPIFIDTLSFRIREKDEPWRAYRQFCAHFLAPLALMAYVDPRMGRLLETNLDGIPLELAARALPLRARLRPRLLAHVVLHGRAERAGAARSLKKEPRVGLAGVTGIVLSLAAAVKALPAPHGSTQWGDYAADGSYTAAGRRSKKEIVARWLADSSAERIWDIGGNAGDFARLGTSLGIRVVCMDSDVLAVARNYERSKAQGDARMLPLLVDIANPTSGRGWRSEERASLLQRGRPDLVMMLALVHHLCLSANIPFPMLADLLADLTPRAIMEWVPPDDAQVVEMTQLRREALDGYSEKAFEEALLTRFHIRERAPIAESGRVLYLLEAK